MTTPSPPPCGGAAAGVPTDDEPTLSQLDMAYRPAPTAFAGIELTEV